MRYEKDLPKSESKTHLKGSQVCRNFTSNKFELMINSCHFMRLKSTRALFKKENTKLNKNLFNKGVFSHETFIDKYFLCSLLNATS